MTRWNVIVLGFEGDESLAEEVSNSLASAWLTPRPPLFSVVSVHNVLASENAQRIDAAVLVIDQRVSESRILRLLSQFEELGIPVMAMLDQRPEPNNPYALAGAVVFDLSQPPAVLAAILQGMLHRQQEVLQLRRELALGQRFQGGMRGEMAKLHDELQLAATVQRELLPRELRNVCGVEFAALWRPVNYVSGDIYDIIPLDHDHVGIFLADAVGHGVPAALMTMVLCQSLKPLENGRSGARVRTPAEVMRILNEAMIRRQGGNTRFASAVYGVLDCRNRVMTLSGAGHPPPLKLSPGGASTELCTSGGLLGVFPDEQFEQIEFDLPLGDRLLLFSDGFEQAFPGPAETNDDRRVPTTRYRAEFEKLLRAPDVASMIDAISGELDQQRGSLHQIDDLTLICVHAGPLALDAGEAPDDLSTSPLLQPRASVA